MPELPEVEVTRLGLLPHLPGRLIRKISFSNKRLRTPVPGKLLTTHLPGKKIIAIDRRAKYLLFRISDGSTIVIHLGMTGKLGLISSQEPPAKHDHLRLLLDDGMEVRFNDSRRFGNVIFWAADEAEKMENEFFSHTGSEPFSKAFSVSYLKQKSRSRRVPVKNFLMDSRVIAGIGNIYANEILFASSLHPEKPANTIRTDEWKVVISSTRKILKKAIRAGGSTISDFLGSSGNPGYFQVQFNVYRRADLPCKKCDHSIVKTVLGGRATFFCPRCQPMNK